MTPEAYAEACKVVNAYAETLKGQLIMVTQSYERDNPGWDFSHIDVKLDEATNTYHFTPMFKKIVK